MFGRSRKKREAELRRKISITIPKLTKRERRDLGIFISPSSFHLNRAVESGSVASVFELLCEGAHVNRDSRTLFLSIDLEQTDTLQLLLQAGYGRHKLQSAYLRKAIAKQNEEAVSLLLDYNSAVDIFCVIEAFRQKNEKLANSLFARLPEKDLDKNLRSIFLESIRQNAPAGVTWIKNNHKNVPKKIFCFELTEAAERADKETLAALGKDVLKYADMSRLSEYFIRKEKIGALSYMMDIFDRSDECDLMMTHAVHHRKLGIISSLRQKGGKITTQTMIFDMLRRETSRTHGENINEFSQRKGMLDCVDDLTENYSRLLLYMARNNKHYTVQYLLKREKNWSEDVVKDCMLFAAKNEHIPMLRAFLQHTDDWDGVLFHQVLEQAETEFVYDQIMKIKDDILGNEWSVDGDYIVYHDRTFEQYEENNGAKRKNNVRLTDIFNFKSCEVTRVVMSQPKDTKDNIIGDMTQGHVTYKNFRDFQDDREIHTAYEKLLKFSKAPEKFHGAYMRSRSKQSHRVIKRRPSGSRPS